MIGLLRGPVGRGISEQERETRESFRRDLRAFLKEELTPEHRAQHLDEREYGGWSPAYIREFRKKLGEAGFIGVGWPEEFGGGGRGLDYELILADELEYFGAPGLDRTITYLPQAIISFGNDEQKRKLLPRIRRGEIALFTAYTESEAGSDLGSLRVPATEVEGGFLIEGQKDFCSQPHIADYAILAARTRTGERKHDGITMFIVDMNDDRISLSRHRTVAGWEHHSVYFDRVVVPRDMVLGTVHQGWKVLMGAVDHERVALSAPGEAGRQLDRLIAWAEMPVGADGTRPVDNDAIADRIVGLAIDEFVARHYIYDVAERHVAGIDIGSDGSLAQLLKRETVRHADDLGLDLLGHHAQIQRASPYAIAGGHVEYESRDHLYYTFAAGGFDIIRNVLAVRGLGLPRG